MSYRAITAIAAAVLCIACVSTDASAYRGGGVRAGGVRVGGVYRGGVNRGVAYRGGVYRRGWAPGVGAAVGLGAAAVGAAAAAPYYYNSTQCGYAPYPPCY
jgi:hypothetical protein